MILCTVMVGTCHEEPSQGCRMYNSKSETECKLWTLGHYDVSVVTNVPLSWEMLTVRKTMNVWGKRVYEKSPYVFLSFPVNLKLL